MIEIRAIALSKPGRWLVPGFALLTFPDAEEIGDFERPQDGSLIIAGFAPGVDGALPGLGPLVAYSASTRTNAAVPMADRRYVAWVFPRLGVARRPTAGVGAFGVRANPTPDSRGTEWRHVLSPYEDT